MQSIFVLIVDPRTHRRQNLRHVIFTKSGILEGMVAKADVITFMNRQFPHTAALANDPL